MSILLSYLQQVWQIVLDLIYPPSCATCDEGGTYFCDACLAAVEHFPEPRCIRCDLPLSSNQLMYCQDCQRGRMMHLEGLRVVGPHVEPLQDAIHALKYEGYRAVALPLGGLLAACWQERGGTSVDGLLPVPLHPERQKERGFNQSALLAKAMSEHLGVPMHDGLLTRIRHTQSQVGLSGRERLQNMQQAFVASPDVAGKRWLLVDDVCTTGSTLMGCAQALHAQGARAVWAITLTRPFYAHKRRPAHDSAVTHVAPPSPPKSQTIWEWDNEVIW